jgi:L-ascorbate metabolism protein UlaG (beta-lactamase superfamily)
MELTLIRNATMVIMYAGSTILTDPMFSPKDTMDPFAGVARNPTVDMIMAPAEIVKDINAVIISHLHPDHFDEVASESIAKDLTLFCQPGDEKNLEDNGFTKVVPVEKNTSWNGITITRTGGLHGSGEIQKMMGNVSGFVLQAEGEPTVYWVGDSIWCDEVASVIKRFSPDIIVTHSGGATIPGHDAIIMDADQTLNLVKSAPEAKVVAIHMESLDHCPVGRKDLRAAANDAGIAPSRLLIPDDGELLDLK